MTEPITEPLSHRQERPKRSAIALIAALAAGAQPERLTDDIRRVFRRNILDSLGCAIAALPGQPFQALRDQFEEYRAPGRCTLAVRRRQIKRHFSTAALCATWIFWTATGAAER